MRSRSKTVLRRYTDVFTKETTVFLVKVWVSLSRQRGAMLYHIRLEGQWGARTCRIWLTSHGIYSKQLKVIEVFSAKTSHNLIWVLEVSFWLFCGDERDNKRYKLWSKSRIQASFCMFYCFLKINYFFFIQCFSIFLCQYLQKISLV